MPALILNTSEQKRRVLSRFMPRGKLAAALMAAIYLAGCGYVAYLVQQETRVESALLTQGRAQHAFAQASLALRDARAILLKCLEGHPEARRDLVGTLPKLRSAWLVLQSEGLQLPDPSGGGIELREAHAAVLASTDAFLTRIESNVTAETQEVRDCEPLRLDSAAAATDLLHFGATLSLSKGELSMRRVQAIATLRDRLNGALYVLLAAIGTALCALWCGWRLAERERAARLRAEEANRARGKFLGVVSHELLSPLQVICASVEILEARLPPGIDPALPRLKAAAQSLRSQVSDLVDVARLNAGRLVIRPRLFRPLHVIESVLLEHETFLVQKGLEIDWEPDPSLDENVLADARRIRQILSNIYSNAIRYTHRGVITLDARIDLERGLLLIELRDTGIGIDAKDIARIWKPYERMEPAREMAEGVGLGLSVVQSLVAAMQGSVTVESEPGQGSVFKLCLPVQRPATRRGAHAPVRMVLIVEDLQALRASLREQLLLEGAAVVDEAEGIAQAKAILSSHPHDTVLIDVELPDGSGIELARWIRGCGAPLAGAYLVVMSASIPQEADVRGLFDAVLEKPVSRPALHRALARIFHE